MAKGDDCDGIYLGCDNSKLDEIIPFGVGGLVIALYFLYVFTTC